MARGFNEREKEYITDALVEQGKKLFTQYGLHKTSIQDITKSVGIAPGSFYKFFDSKEELYFGILEMEEEKIKEQFANIDLSQVEQPKEVIKRTIKKMIQMVDANPLIRELYFGSTMKNLVKKLPSEVLEKHFEKDASSLLFVIEEWETEGVVFSEKAEVIAGVLRSLFVMMLHQQEIGQEVYEETMELFIDSIVDHLVKEGG